MLRASAEGQERAPEAAGRAQDRAHQSQGGQSHWRSCV